MVVVNSFVYSVWFILYFFSGSICKIYKTDSQRDSTKTYEEKCGLQQFLPKPSLLLQQIKLEQF